MAVKMVKLMVIISKQAKSLAKLSSSLLLLDLKKQILEWKIMRHLKVKKVTGSSKNDASHASSGLSSEIYNTDEVRINNT